MDREVGGQGHQEAASGRQVSQPEEGSRAFIKGGQDRVTIRHALINEMGINVDVQIIVIQVMVSLTV